MTHLPVKAALAASAQCLEPRCYRLHGLEMWSQIELPELVAVDPSRADLTVRLAAIHRDVPADRQNGYFEFSDEQSFFAWASVGKFLVTGNCLIEIEPAEGVDERLLAFPLLGPVLAMALHGRGALVLHASAVEIGGSAVAFLGNKGAGKSTTAAAMIEAGHGLLTDDVLALSQDHAGRWVAEAAFPQLKLSAAAGETLGPDGALVREPAHPSIDKQLHLLSSKFRTDAAPLARVFVLRRSAGAAITPLEPVEAFKALAGFSYAARFGSEALSGRAAARQFAAIGSVLAAAPVGVLDVPDGLERMPDVVKLIESCIERRGS